MITDKEETFMTSNCNNHTTATASSPTVPFTEECMGKLLTAYRDTGIIARHDPFYLGIVLIPVIDHRPEACAAIVPVDQLQMISRRSRRGNGLIDDFDRFFLTQAISFFST